MSYSLSALVDEFDGLAPLDLRVLGDLIALAKGGSDRLTARPTPVVRQLFHYWESEPGLRSFFEKLAANYAGEYAETGPTLPTVQGARAESWQAQLIKNSKKALKIPSRALLALDLVFLENPSAQPTVEMIGNTLRKHGGNTGANLSKTLDQMATRYTIPPLEQYSKEGSSRNCYRFTAAGRERIAELEKFYSDTSVGSSFRTIT